MNGIIYKITNKVNGKSYIGQTTQEFKKRWRDHCNGKSNCVVFKKAIAKYGKDNFEVIFLHQLEGENRTEIRVALNKLETEEIAKHGSLVPNGYNIAKGGHGNSGKKYAPGTFHLIGRKLSEVTKEKIAAANRGLKRPWMAEHMHKIHEKCKKPVRCIETGQEWRSIKECAESFGAKPEAIHRVLRGVRKRFRKLHFEYVKPNL